MLFESPTSETLYDALVRRDPAYDGLHFVCVTSTRIFCRFTCSARKPKLENCIFEETIVACLEAGFRPCKRCRPMLHHAHSEPLVTDLLAELDRDPGYRWREGDLTARGYDPSTVRRSFKKRFGMSFLEIARLRRLGNAVDSLKTGEDVISAQLDAGYESGSGFRSAIQQLFGAAPAHLRDHVPLRADWIATPIGTMLAIADDHALHLLEFIDRPALPAEIRNLQKRHRATIRLQANPVLEETARQLDRYFSGELDAFAVTLAQHGTPFERSVWKTLCDIPPAETRSYSQIAAGIGRESAVRAVARANGKNQLAILIPCHRVIGADGGLTGYGGGLWRKQWLLEHERRAINDTLSYSR